MSTGTGVALGVDLGTTWTGAALCSPGGEAEVLVLGDSGPAMPSVIARRASANLVRVDRPKNHEGMGVSNLWTTDPATGSEACSREA